jgi:predicted glycosyltransferase
MISLRRNLLTAAARSFRPHILIADYIPLGKDRELEGAVRLVRSLPRRLLCLGLRDIINDQQRADEYLRQSVFKPVRDYFDTVFVYSDQDWVNFHAEYDIPDDLIKRFVHVGYVVNTAPVDGTSALLDQLFQSIGPGERLVIAGAGGGKDALGMLLMIIKAWCSLDFGVLPPCRLVIVAGPYSLSPEREALRSALSGCTNAQVVDEVPSLYKILQRAELYIGACGYNTTTEVLNAETRAIFIPREQVDSTEQLIRAQRLQAAGQWDVLQEGPSAPFELRDRLVAVLGGPQHTRGCAPTIRLDGASQTANRIYDWWLNRRSLTFER